MQSQSGIDPDTTFGAMNGMHALTHPRRKTSFFTACLENSIQYPPILI